MERIPPRQAVGYIPCLLLSVHHGYQHSGGDILVKDKHHSMLEHSLSLSAVVSLVVLDCMFFLFIFVA